MSKKYIVLNSNQFISLIFILTFQALSLNILKSQYVPFKTKDASWKVSIEKSYCYDNFCGYNEYHIDGDTLINSKIYHKIYQYWWDPFEPEIEIRYFGCIRNSIEEKKVYSIWLYDQTSELTLYNFDIKLNDTIAVIQDTAIVVFIDSIEVGSSYRKQYHLESIFSKEGIYVYPYSIIEGIGSTNGLFENVSIVTADIAINRLVCYKEEGNPLFPINTSSSDCESLVSTEYPIEEKNLFTIYPNPTKDYCIVSNAILGVECHIYSIQGICLDIYSMEESEQKIDLSTYPSGVYSIRFMYDGNYLNNKILIIK